MLQIGYGTESKVVDRARTMGPDQKAEQQTGQGRGLREAPGECAELICGTLEEKIGPHCSKDKMNHFCPKDATI